jgi:hypothetical protein
MQGMVTGCSGRPSILTHDQYEETINKILSGHAEKRPMTVFEICDVIRERWGVEMVPNTFFHFMYRRTF